MLADRNSPHKHVWRARIILAVDSRRQRMYSTALAAAEVGFDYFSSDRHYESLARRIVTTLRSGGRFVLVTGDPLADPKALSEALGNVTGSGCAVTVVPCESSLTRKELELRAPILAGLRPSTGLAVTSEFSLPGSALLVFDRFDQLSDEQIQDIYEALHCDEVSAAGVLLAPLNFLVRLERPALRLLKTDLAAHFGVQEVGEDEAVAFLHNQLLAQRDRRIEARGFRRGILMSLSARCCHISGEH